MLTAHAFSCPVIDVTMYVAIPEIAMSAATIITDNRTGVGVFTDSRS